MVDDRAALVKQVKEANDIVEVVSGYVALRPAGATFKGLCPFHDDHTPSFTVDPRHQNFRCWACNKFGDVISFIQEYDRISFREALEHLANRAGISLQGSGPSPRERTRAAMLKVVTWASAQFAECLHETPDGEPARKYLAERKLQDETIRRFGLGFAPLAGDWLVRRATRAGVSLELLEQVGLIAPRQAGRGYYDRFRDRVMFPIRDARGNPIGFGGRVLPTSPLSARGPKYYNSTETPLFSKSDCLYGLDQARQAGASTGYLAVVEGYTDVLMAHQHGVAQVVATMGTALNERHVRHLRRFVPRVVLVFDADAGGNTGVDRALELFASQEMDLAVATLPEGLDPCDLLAGQGAEPFRKALAEAVDALDFKLARVLAQHAGGGIEAKRRAVDAVLGIIALAPVMPGQAGAMKRQLIVGRIAQRLGLMEENIWMRLDELRAQRSERAARRDREGAEAPRKQERAPSEERELLEVLLAEPALVATAAAQVSTGEVRHPEVRRVLEVLYELHDRGETPDLDRIRLQLDDMRLAEYLLRLQGVGRLHKDRPAWLQRLLLVFRERHTQAATRELQNQLQAAGDHDCAVALLRQLQDQTLNGDGPSRESGDG